MARIVVNIAGFSGSLEELARAVEAGEIAPSSVSVHDAIRACLEEMRGTGKEMSLDDTGDFLAAASALVHAKSKALLPAETAPGDAPCLASDAAGDGEEGTAGNEALIARLMQYRVFKEAAEELARREEAWRDVFLRNSVAPGPGDAPLPAQVGVADLVSALRDVLQGVADEEFAALPGDDLAIADKMDAILARLGQTGELAFRELFRAPINRVEVIAIFLALLELIRIQRAIVRQKSRFGEILIYLAPGGTADGV